MNKIAIFLGFIFLLESTLFGFFSSPKATVLPLHAKEQSASWIGVALQSLIEDDIKSLDSYELLGVEGLQHDEENPLLFKELQNITNSKDAEKLMQEKNIELLFGGSYRLDGDKLFIDLWMINDEKKVQKSFQISYSQAISAFTLQWYQFAKNTLELSNNSLNLFYENNPNSIIALQYYAKGLEELYKYIDTKIKAKRKVAHFNTKGKADILEKMKKQQSNGENMPAIVQMMRQLNKNMKQVAHSMSDTLSKEYLYQGAHFFKEAISVDKNFGPSYAQLANIIYATSEESPYTVPPKSYVEDLCNQADNAKVEAKCQDGVTDYKALERDNTECSDADYVFKSFSTLLTSPTSSYNYSAYLNNSFDRIDGYKTCINKKDMIALLDKGQEALRRHFKKRAPKKFIETEYEIAYLYKDYTAYEKANRLYLELFKYLETIPKENPKKVQEIGNSSQDEIIMQIQAKMQAALGKQLSQMREKNSTTSIIDSLNFTQKYRLKIAQKLALNYAKKGDRNKANQYLSYLKPYNVKDLDDIIDAISISKIYFYLKEYKKALDKAQAIIAVRENKDMGHIGRQKEFLDLYLYIAKLYSYNKDYVKTKEYTTKASKKLLNIRNFIATNDDKTLTWLHRYTQEISNILLNIALAEENTQDIERLYAEIADKKAQKLYTNNALHRMINTQLNYSLKPLLKELQEKEKMLATLDENTTNKMALRKDMQDLQQKLLVIENINHVIDRKNMLQAKTLYKSIPKNTILLDLFEIEERYYAFFIHKGNIKLVDIGDKEEIDKLIDTKSFAQNSKLYKKIFANGLPKEKRLIIIPDSKFYFVPFEALKTPDNSFLIESKSISYLPSVLMLKEHKDKQNITEITLFANPDYEDNANTDKNVNRDRTLSGYTFSPLPGTMLEAKKIQKITQKADIKLRLYTQEEASEENFYKINSPELLHIATHGYFIPSAKGYRATGIVLSGANSSIKKGIDRGIISAEKILDYYNYTNTKLVVLSACDTGTGKLSALNMIQSLGNSFLMVGASTVMINLWEIPDIETAYMMKLFYENLLIQHMNIINALREAKLKMIQRDMPYEKWASLVLFGNATP